MKPADKVTVPSLRARKGAGPKIAMVTAYDATLARLLDEGGADILLIGDSLGMVVQGHANTLAVTVDDICYHGRAVARAARRAHLVGDMPFMSFQVSPEKALENAGAMLKSGGFEAVKLEGGMVVAEHVHRIVQAGIPVMGHVGLLPQSVHAMGGFKVQGKEAEGALALVAEAKALAHAGCFALVLEGVPDVVAAMVTAAVDVPTIGIGAGPHCDGQVLVYHDLLGIEDRVTPKFVRRYASLKDDAVAAIAAYADDVRTGAFPNDDESYHVSDEVAESLELYGSTPPPGA